MRRFIFVGLLFAAFLASDTGILVAGTQRGGELECTYFTGLGFVERGYWFAQNDIMGRAACPRLIGL